MADAPAQQGVVNPQAGYLNAEARRSLDNATFSSNKVVSVQIPRDTVVKRMMLNLTATHDVTYAAGSPVTSEFGVFERLCPQVEVIVNGNRVIKSVKPHMLRMHAALFGTAFPRRAYSTSAAAFTTLRASREWLAGTVAYPATTQFLLFNESAPISFELPFGYDKGKNDTELDTRDVASADLKFYFSTLENLQRDGVGASVTYANSNVFVSTQIVENRARPRPQSGDVLFDYVEYTNSQSTTSQSSGRQLELQTGNYLCGIGIMCRNGDTNQTPQENLLTRLTLRINGSTAIQGPVSHKDLQDDNQARYGIDDQLGFADYNSTIASTASAHPMRGFAFMNLIRNGDWNTGINTSRSALVDTIKLEYDTPASSGTDAATYTNGVQVTAHTHEIRPFVYQK